MIIGCDFHPRFQQIAFVDQEAGEYGERRLNHAEEAERFYRSLAGRPVRIGAEATGNFRWFRQSDGGTGSRVSAGGRERRSVPPAHAGRRPTGGTPGTF